MKVSEALAALNKAKEDLRRANDLVEVLHGTLANAEACLCKAVRKAVDSPGGDQVELLCGTNDLITVTANGTVLVKKLDQAD